MSSSTYPDPQVPAKESTASFWHKQPDEFLVGHRTTEDLPSEADIVIIGTGIAGAQTARYLAEQDGGAWIKDRRVVMLEAREACWGATGRNGGHCKPQLYPFPHLQHLIDDLGVDEARKAIIFEQMNLSFITQYIENNNVDCEFVKLPSCDAYFDEKVFQQALASVETIRKHAPELATMLTVVTDKGTLEELRVPTAVGAVVVGNAAKLWPYKLISHILKDLIQNHGFNLQTSTPVTAISTLNDGSPVPVHRIHTPRGYIISPIVIHATNAFASHLVPALRDVIYPVRAQMSSLQPPSSLLSKPLTHTYGLVNGDRGKDEYLVQEQIREDGSGGSMLLGGARVYAKNEGVGVTDDDSVESDVGSYLKASVGKYFAGETGYPNGDGDNNCDANYMWTGIMAFSADERPWVGKVPESEGQYVLAGFEGHGMALTTGCGKALAELIHHRYPTLPHDAYSTYWTRNICAALYDFEGRPQSPDWDGKEISLKVNDIVDVIEKAQNGWWYGTIIRSSNSESVSQSGWFPSNHVEELPASQIFRASEPAVQDRLDSYPEGLFTWFPQGFELTQERIKAARAKASTLKALYLLRDEPRSTSAQKSVETQTSDLSKDMLYDRYKLQFAVKLIQCGKDDDSLIEQLESTALENIEKYHLRADKELVRKTKLVKALKRLLDVRKGESHTQTQSRIINIIQGLDSSLISEPKSQSSNSAGSVRGRRRERERRTKLETNTKVTHTCECANCHIVVRDFAFENNVQPEKDLRASQILSQHPYVASLKTTDQVEEDGDEWVVIDA